MRNKVVSFILLIGVLLILTPGVVSAVSEKTIISVTDASPWFSKGSNSGHPEYWKTYTHSGHTYIWTYVGGMTGNPSQPDCWTEFRSYFSQSGQYDVYALFYADPQNSKKVPYTIYYDGGSATVKVDEYAPSYFTWKQVHLGTWNFKAGADTLVVVTDATGEPYNGTTTLNVDTIKFVKVQTVPDPPTPTYPGSSSSPGQEIGTLTPTLQWQGVSNADYYALAISKYPYGSGNIVYNPQQLYGTSHTVPAGKLEYGKKYRWNMQAHNSVGWSAISSRLYFQTYTPVQRPDPPTPTYPGSGTEPGPEIGTLTPTLQWTGVSNADYYALAISKYPYGSGNIVYNPQQVYGTSHPVPSGVLEPTERYRWNMQAYNSAGWSDVSIRLYFETYTPVQRPDPPTPTYPGSETAPGPEIDTFTPTLQWTGVSNADYYALAISKYPYGAGNIVYNPQQVYGTSHQVPSGVLEEGKKYRWNMQAYNSAGWSDVSIRLYFQIDTEPNTPPPIEVVLDVPYIHQCWDTPEDFDGRWACSATSAVMVLAYYGTLDPWSCDCSQPYPHTSDYGNYISNIYTYNSHTFDDMSEDASGNPTYGAYGYIYHPGSIKEKMVNYFILHGLDSEIDYSPTEVEVKAEIDAGYPVVAVTWLTDEGHWIVIKGYTDDGHYIVNDPYGSKPYGTGNYNGADVQYTWSEMRVGERKVILAHGTVPVNNYPEGIDVSSIQGYVDWSQVYNAGYRFAFARASWGDENPPAYIDDYFETNMQNGQTAGMLISAYHFAYPEYTDPVSEAHHFLNVAGDYLIKGYLRPVLDLEDDPGFDSYPYRLGKEALSNWVHEWMNTVKNETGIEPIIYTSSDYANNYLNISINQYDLWIAHWTYNPNNPPNTGIWDDWDFWQYSDQGSVPGVSGYVDLDLFNSDMSRLNTFMISALLQGDINGDGKVDFTDFAILGSQWLQPPGEPSADIAPEGGDSFVDFLDLALVAEHWLEGIAN